MGLYEESYTAFAFETLTIDATAGGIGCTSATYQPSGGGAAERAVLGPLESGQIRYNYDGTAPTATTGHLLEVGDTLILLGLGNINLFRAIRTGGVSGTLPVTYER